MDRRRFLQTAGGATAAAWLAGCGPAGAASEDPRASAGGESAGGAGSNGGSRSAATSAADRAGLALDVIGLQLYTVRSLMAEDVEDTLAEVAAIGYREVEFAGYFDRPPAELRATLDGLGLRAPSVHLPIQTFRTGLDAALEAATTLGHAYLVLPYLDPGDRGSLDGYRRLAEEMNGFGERCRSAGLRFGYHNHDFELAELEGRIPLEVLIEETDPGLVTFEVDFYWLVNGGGDPLDTIARYPGRFELCHVKDRAADGAMVDVGAGVIDFATIFQRSEEAGLRHYFVEHDRPDGPLRSIAASYDHLAGL